MEAKTVREEGHHESFDIHAQIVEPEYSDLCLGFRGMCVHDACERAMEDGSSQNLAHHHDVGTEPAPVSRLR
jgi:hypothetical protein